MPTVTRYESVIHPYCEIDWDTPGWYIPVPVKGTDGTSFLRYQRVAAEQEAHPEDAVFCRTPGDLYKE